MKPCTEGKRHSWTWVYNVKRTNINHGTGRGSISMRGRYACHCGATKLGNPQ